MTVTKHYYAETERITSQLGRGRFADVNTSIADGTATAAKKQAVLAPIRNRQQITSSNVQFFAYLSSLTNRLNDTSECYFYHPDHLGSSSWITDSAGTAVQHLHYLPFGETFVSQRSADFDAMYTFSAKEKDAETGYSYFGARYYSSDLSIWLSVDPQASKYPSLSPYVYCANNPVKLVDPNGEDVYPVGEDEYMMILNTLPEKDRAYVQLDKNGFINKDLINSHQSESSNYNGLLAMVNDNVTYDVILADTEFPYMDQEGVLKSQPATYQGVWQYSIYDKEGSTTNQLSTGEGGNLGVTLFPGRDCPTNSPDNNVKIYVNKQLSPAGRAESFSHEGFGHALLYCLNGHNAVNAGHIFGSMGSDLNTKLKSMIISAKKETIKNMHQ